jgi:streptogrisin D
LFRPSPRRTAITAVAAAGLAASVLKSAPQAGAVPTRDGDRPINRQRGLCPNTAADQQVREGALTAGVARHIPADAGSFHSPRRETMVVNVTRRSDVATVRAAGAAPRLVDHSSRELRTVTRALTRRATIPGTSWAVDTRANVVAIEADSTVTGAQMKRLRTVASRFAERTTVRRTPGVLSTKVLGGGEAIYGTNNGARCSVGFSVTNGSSYFFLTAGHCTNGSATWYENSSRTSGVETLCPRQLPGQRLRDRDDAQRRLRRRLALQRQRPGHHRLRQRVREPDGAAQWQHHRPAQRSGDCPERHRELRRRLGQRPHPDHRLCGAGRPGGSLFAGSTAQGLTSGGSGNWTTGGTTYFQPVTEALSVYGVRVY